MSFTRFGRRSDKYDGVLLCTILYIKFSFLRFNLSANVSQPVSKYMELMDENIGSPVTILAAFNCTCSSLFASILLQPSQSSLPYSKGVLYKCNIPYLTFLLKICISVSLEKIHLQQLTR